MEELTSYSSINTVEQLTNVINTELKKAAISFVRVGYLLKKARDEDILKDSGYPDIYTYANMKFGLDKSQVSRFININDRYSIGGYSEHLKEEYEGFGYSKLALMLTLPEEINKELSPEYTKSEINTIKAEYEAEQKISDLEVMMEGKPDGPNGFIAQIVKELNDEHPESAVYLSRILNTAEKMNFEVTEATIREAYIPEGAAAYSVRISGQGRFMITMKESEIFITSLRDPANKTPLTWTEFKEALVEDMKVRDFPDNEPEPEKKKKPEKVKPAKTQNKKPVAPVQQSVEQCEDNVAHDKTDEEEDTTPKEAVEDPEDKAAAGDTVEEPAAGEETEEAQTAAGVEKVTPAAEDILTSSQRDMLEWLDLIRRKVVPEDGSRPDWQGILDEVKTMERYVKQFTY